MSDTPEVDKKVEAAGARVETLLAGVGRVIVGQRPLLERMVIGLLCEGHVLVEGLPGLAKSLMVQTLAQSLSASFTRIQFTPDLLPADLTGTQIFNPRTGEFSLRKGPLFANIILADEINRAPPKVQSALLEAMQERQVTISGETLALPQPFLVLATQNPIEHEGTYPLPEAQVDRFLLKVDVPYPSNDEEMEIVDRMAMTRVDLSVEPVMDVEEIFELRKLVNEIYVDEKVKRYAVDLVAASRAPESRELIRYGASPRASIALILAARAEALLRGRSYVTPRDVKRVGPDVLRHRVILTFEAEAREMDAAAVVSRLFDLVEVP